MADQVDTIELAVDEESTDDDATDAPSDTEPASDPEPEFIELSYWEWVLAEGFTRTQEPEEDCDNSDPDVLICEWEMTFESVTTHLGNAHDVSTGTLTQDFSESCEGLDGTVGHLVTDEGMGSIIAPWGDELRFRLDSTWCSAAGRTPVYWRVVGGTGRFEDAFGVMSGALAPDPEYVTISVGTLHVRADLWEELLPADR